MMVKTNNNYSKISSHFKKIKKKKIKGYKDFLQLSENKYIPLNFQLLCMKKSLSHSWHKVDQGTEARNWQATYFQPRQLAVI